MDIRSAELPFRLFSHNMQSVFQNRDRPTGGARIGGVRGGYRVENSPDVAITERRANCREGRTRVVRMQHYHESKRAKHDLTQLKITRGVGANDCCLTMSRGARPERACRLLGRSIADVSRVAWSSAILRTQREPSCNVR